MKTCQMCKREYEGITSILFIPDKDYSHPFRNKGENFFVCSECNMSYLAQFFKMSNREITEWLNWINTEPLFKDEQ